MSAHNLRQRRARLLREIAAFAARLAQADDPQTPRQRATQTRLARCIAQRARDLAGLPWPASY